jgi:hypothetical protein
MRKISLIILTLILTGCINLDFDSTEYSRFIDIKYIADNRNSICQNSQDIQLAKNDLQELVDKEYVYSKYRSGRAIVTTSTEDLKNLISEFNSRQSMSKVYCIDKLENISNGALLIITTLGKQ